MWNLAINLNAVLSQPRMDADVDVAVGELQPFYHFVTIWRMRWHGIRYSFHILHASALCKCNCNCNLAHESLAFPFVFCNYALSWIVVDVVAVLLLALQASSFAFNYCSHFSNFSPSVLRCRLCNTALSLSSVSAICYLHLTDSCMYVFATESASCSANIMLNMHFTLRARMHLLPCPSFHFPFSLGNCAGKVLWGNGEAPREVICLLMQLRFYVPHHG